ncbi:DUF2513 domain-containing protein [Ralstonia sp. 1B3]|uniref:DUF2513 domain-containing protein n=1 Tax=Ralstonia sp. 1B3 TaxID=2997421 RepID=UPI002FC9955C
MALEPEVESQLDGKIDGTRKMALVIKILRHVAENSYTHQHVESSRDVTMFDGFDAGSVFLHYQYLIGAKFINGHVSVQTNSVFAYHLTWEGHDLLDTLAKPLSRAF